MKFKKIMTYEKSARKIRIARVIWERGVVGKGGYSAFASLSIMPRLLVFKWEREGFQMALLGICLHHRKSYGGRFV